MIEARSTGLRMGEIHFANGLETEGMVEAEFVGEVGEAEEMERVEAEFEFVKG